MRLLSSFVNDLCIVCIWLCSMIDVLGGSCVCVVLMSFVMLFVMLLRLCFCMDVKMLSIGCML